MNKAKKVIATIRKRFLRIKSFISTTWYVNSANRYLRFIGCDLKGHVKFIAPDVKIDYFDPSRIHIGAGSVITSGVTILVHDFSIECGLTAIGKNDPEYEQLMVRDVVIGNNCFIGQNSFIKPGTVIGDNCIVGAGSVVGGTVPPGSIVAGNPAKVIRQTAEWAEKRILDGHAIKGNVRRKKDRN